MTILFLHGWQSVPGGVKPTFLASRGHTVVNPKLPDDDFDQALAIAQAGFDQHRPQVIVGSSRGGAVAMNLHAADTPLVLLCPAWKKYGRASTVTAKTTILHSRADDVVPFADSGELVRNSGLPAACLLETGSDHRLADPESLELMARACEQHLPMEQMAVPCCGTTGVIRLKELPHIYGTDFDLFRCGRCGKPWVAYWVNAGPGGGWEPVSDADASTMMSLADPELRIFMRKWAQAFN